MLRRRPGNGPQPEEGQDATTKSCSSCKRLLPFDAFWVRSGTASGRQSQCKKCNVRRRQEIRRDNKQRLIEYLGGSCRFCRHTSRRGVSLSIDHQTASQINHYDRQGILEWTWKRIVKEIAAGNCQLLCLNCHAEVTEDRRRALLLEQRVVSKTTQPGSNPGPSANPCTSFWDEIEAGGIIE